MPTDTENNVKIETIDFTQLGSGLYTEEVVIDPNVDTSAPSRPIDEVDAQGKTIVYRAVLTAPAPGAKDFDGNDRPFVSRESKFFPATADKPEATFSNLVLNFDLKIIGFADPLADQTQLQGRAGKTHEVRLTSRLKKKDGQPFSEFSDLAQKLGVFNNIQLGEGQKTISVDNESLAQYLAQAIATGQTEVGVTVTWTAGWSNGELNPDTGRTARGSYAFKGQKNFPKDTTGRSQVVVQANGKDAIARVKLNNFVKL